MQMTRERLQRYSKLTHDIVRRKERIETLTSIAEGTTSHITGMPGRCNGNDKVGTVALELITLRAELEVLLIQSENEYVEITRYIESIDDPKMRQILQYKRVNGLPWEQVAECIGGGITGESCRKAEWRLLSGRN